MSRPNYTKRQLLTLFVFIWAEFCMALGCSIQAPFYPPEAEKKGAKPSEYGFVFGIYELVVFICCPIFGKYMNILGVKFVTNAGIFVVSVTCTLFGFLTMIQSLSTFIAFSFAIRILEGAGYAAFTTAIFSIIAKEFPEDVGTTFAGVETFFGLGLILGPTIGGALYEIGGFLLPFVLVGSLLAIGGFLILFLLPPQNDPISTSDSHGLLFLLTKAPFIFGTATVFSSAYSIGFVQATLEPHLRVLNLTMFEISLLFIVTGIVYFIFAPIWGKLCDRLLEPHTVTTIGSLFIALAFLFMGPAPFIPLPLTVEVLIFSLILHGFGNAATLIGSFSGFHKDSLILGLPDSISTYALVSGLWTSTFALGAFVGPSAAGILFDQIGFPWASQSVVLLHMLLFIVSITYIGIKYAREGATDPRQMESDSLIKNDEHITSCYQSI